MQTLDDYHWLVSDTGRDWLVRVSTDARLSSETNLRKAGLSSTRAALVAEQIELRRRAARRFQHADQLFFTTKSLQQATDGRIATYKATRFAARTVIDLCCGLGGDLLGLGARGPALGIDADPLLALLAEVNCRTLGLSQASAQVGDACSIGVAPETAIHIDPDRRPGGRRTVQLAQHEPDLTQRAEWRTHPGGLAIKLAPATETHDAFFADAELEWIGHSRECQQLVSWFGPLTNRPGRRTATVLQQDGSATTLVGNDAPPLRLTDQLGPYLCEPASPVLAAGLAGTLAQQFDLDALTPGGGYLSGSQPLTSPWHQTFELIDQCAWREKNVKRMLTAHGVGPLEIKKRGVELDTGYWQRRLSGREGQTACLFILPVGRRNLALLARRLQRNAASQTQASTNTESGNAVAARSRTGHEASGAAPHDE